MSNDLDQANLYYRCPNYHCGQQLLKAQMRTGHYCFCCGTQVRVRVDDRPFDDDAKTIPVFVFGFIKGFLVAGAFGLIVGHGYLYGTIWGIIWGLHRYSTGTPNWTYNTKYLDVY
jgi:hypothetical protein